MKYLVNKAKNTHKMLAQDIGKIKHCEKEELVLQLQKNCLFCLILVRLRVKLRRDTAP